MNTIPSWVRASSLAASILVLALVADSSAQGPRTKPRSLGRQANVPRNYAPRSTVPRNYARGAMMSRQAGPYRNRNMMANQNNGSIISGLSSALGLLAQADHDYQGHRARAMHHIGTAIRTLQPAAVRRGPLNPISTSLVSGKGAGTGAKNAMPQATSDAHLRNALQSLNSVQTQLASTGVSAPNRARARVSVQRAVQELNTALNIR